MPLLSPTDLTFNGREIESLSQSVFEKTYQKPTITEFHQIVTGIKAKQQIALLGLLGLTGQKKTGCTTPESTQTIEASEKFWEPVIVAEKFGECWDQLKQIFFVWGTKNGIKRDDLTDTDFAAFLEDRLSDALYEAVLRTAWFADTAAANTDDTPAGVVKAGVDVNYFNAINGFWIQLFAIGAASAARRVTITKNTGNSYVNQAFDSTDTSNMVATGIFADMKYKADLRLRDQQNLVFVASQTLVDQYAKELRSKSIDASFVRIESGYQAVMFEGIPIIPFNFFDRTIKDYYDDGAKLFRPHRAVLTTADNLAIGVETPENLAELDAWYSNDDEKYYVKYAVNMDAKVLEDYLVQVAY